MAQINVNDTQLNIALRNFTTAIRPEPLLRIFGQVMRDSREKTFREQGSPAGSWPSLAASTLKRRKFQTGDKILIRTGRLKNSNTEAVVSNGSTGRLLIGNNLVYGAIHQVGGLAGRGHKARIPARPYLVFRPEDPARMQTAGERFIQSQANATGLGTGTA